MEAFQESDSAVHSSSPLPRLKGRRLRRGVRGFWGAALAVASDSNLFRWKRRRKQSLSTPVSTPTQFAKPDENRWEPGPCLARPPLSVHSNNYEEPDPTPQLRSTKAKRLPKVDSFSISNSMSAGRDFQIAMLTLQHLFAARYVEALSKFKTISMKQICAPVECWQFPNNPSPNQGGAHRQNQGTLRKTHLHLHKKQTRGDRIPFQRGNTSPIGCLERSPEGDLQVLQQPMTLLWGFSGD